MCYNLKIHIRTKDLEKNANISIINYRLYTEYYFEYMESKSTKINFTCIFELCSNMTAKNSVTCVAHITFLLGSAAVADKTNNIPNLVFASCSLALSTKLYCFSRTFSHLLHSLCKS